jgi:hypothetical protein
MGMFDEFFSVDGSLSVQLKNGDCTMGRYTIGDACPLADGCYHGYEGVVAVRYGVVLSVTAKSPDGIDLPHFTKWGDRYDPVTATGLATQLAL